MREIRLGDPFSWRSGLPRFFHTVAVAVAVIIALAAGAASAQLPGAEDLLARSIAYHDPEGVWSTGIHEVALSSTRPGGPDSESRIVIDNTDGSFVWHRTQADGSALEARVVEDRCVASVNGSPPTGDQIREYDLSCERLQWMRNYHVYLYGLPMKLRDPGTILHPTAQRATFQGRAVYALKVSYDPEVGGDTWYFYLDPTTYALIGYRFYHDESINDGEYITLEGEASSGPVRIPKIRSWYTNADDRHLGTDTVVSITTRIP